MSRKCECWFVFWIFNVCVCVCVCVCPDVSSSSHQIRNNESVGGVCVCVCARAFEDGLCWLCLW